MDFDYQTIVYGIFLTGFTIGAIASKLYFSRRTNKLLKTIEDSHINFYESMEELENSFEELKRESDFLEENKRLVEHAGRIRRDLENYVGQRGYEKALETKVIH